MVPGGQVGNGPGAKIPFSPRPWFREGSWKAELGKGAAKRYLACMKKLLASIHDVSPKFEGAVAALADRLAGHLGGLRLAMLAGPDHWAEAPIGPGTPFATRLRGWADAGVEMFVHGWFHRDTSEHKGADAWKAKHMTAGEGEFLGLDHGDALDRMTRGKALVEDIIGRPAAGFIAPA